MNYNSNTVSSIRDNISTFLDQNARLYINALFLTPGKKIFTAMERVINVPRKKISKALTHLAGTATCDITWELIQIARELPKAPLHKSSVSKNS